MSATEPTGALPGEPDDTPGAPVLPAPVRLAQEGYPPAPAAEEAHEEAGTASGPLARVWVCIRDQWREIVGPLKFRAFVSESVGDMALACRYLPRLAFDWVLAPDPRADSDAWKQIGVRLAVVLVPPAGAVALMLRPGGEVVVPFGLLAWMAASWLVADEARADARVRAVARRKKAANAGRARLARIARRHGLTLEEVERAFQDEGDGERGGAPQPAPPQQEEEPAGDEEAEQDPQPWSEAQINEYVWGWVLDQIGDKNGIHLDVLFALARASKDDPPLVRPETTQADFRRGLEGRGIKVGQVKVDGSNRTGVNKAHVPRA